MVFVCYTAGLKMVLQFVMYLTICCGIFGKSVTISTMAKYNLDKSIWTQEDFDMMGWHDTHIYGFTIERNDSDPTADLLFDIDYIFKWVQPVHPQKHFTFWIAPCTLIFKGCFDLHIDLATGGDWLDLLEISDLNLKSKIEEDKKFIYEWEMELQQGLITFKSYGFEQIVKKYPIYVSQQVLTLEQRESINFEKKPVRYQEG